MNSPTVKGAGSTATKITCAVNWVLEKNKRIASGTIFFGRVSRQPRWEIGFYGFPDNSLPTI
jgi:hypothetical protein